GKCKTSRRPGRGDRPSSTACLCLAAIAFLATAALFVQRAYWPIYRGFGLYRTRYGYILDSSPLPIDAALPALTAPLRGKNAAVLVAPPGAGKTTRVPLVLAAEAWAQGSAQGPAQSSPQGLAKPGRILVLEPRRLAARAAAARMAHNLGEAVGETVGLRV